MFFRALAGRGARGGGGGGFFYFLAPIAADSKVHDCCNDCHASTPTGDTSEANIAKQHKITMQP